MILMDIRLDNFCAFHDFHLNMSYPKKIIHSTIKNEHLSGFPNFRYQKLNILMGTNATGKTSLGMTLMYIFNFISRKEFTKLLNMINNPEKEASFSFDFVQKGKELYRINAVFFAKESERYSMDQIQVTARKIDIRENDNYEKCVERLIKSGKDLDFSEIPHFGWLFTYPQEDHYNGAIDIKKVVGNKYKELLKRILMTLDNSIIDVIKVEDVENAYGIVMSNDTLIIQKGEVLQHNILSSGTRAGIDITNMIYSMMNHTNGFYYCDEKFSYIHSDIEKTLLSIMISVLGEDEQLFYTTHNVEIAEMDLPKHSFHFMRKYQEDGKYKIDCVRASDYLKKSTDSVKNAIDNDVFNFAPDLSLLEDIENIMTEG